MPARVAFKYAIVRVVPRVDRGEFVNAGVVLYCPQQAFLGARIELDEPRLLRLQPASDLPTIRRHLDAVTALCAGEPSAGPLAALPLTERFHFIVAPRSTIVQTSPVHAGVTEDPAAALDHLLATVVRLPAP